MYLSIILNVIISLRYFVFNFFHIFFYVRCCFQFCYVVFNFAIMVCCFQLFSSLLISFNKQVLLRNLLILDLYIYRFEMRKMWFCIKWDWQSNSRTPKIAACGNSGRRVQSSFNFNCNFFQRHCVIMQARQDVLYCHQKNCRRSKMML